MLPVLVLVVVISGCSARSASGAGSGGAGSGGAGGCRESERLGAWEPGSLGRAFPAISRIIREPEGAWVPGRPEPGQRSAKPATVRNTRLQSEPARTGAKERENSLYI